MREIRNFIFVVDGHRRQELMRSTAGRYRVGAKDAKEAERFLREKIRFGSPCLLCEDTNGSMTRWFNSHVAAYKEVILECPL